MMGIKHGSVTTNAAEGYVPELEQAGRRPMREIRNQAEAGLAVTIMAMQTQQRELLHDRLQGWRMTRAGCQYLQLEWWIHW